MKHYYLGTQPPEGGGEVRLQGRDYRRLVSVLRMKEGDTFPGVDPSGGRHVLRVLAVSRGIVRLRADPEPGHEGGTAASGPGAAKGVLDLYQCVPKGRKMDAIVRQAAEAGVRRIVPVRSERSLGGVDEARLERWRRIAVSALEQCGRVRPVEIGESVELTRLAVSDPGRTGIVFHHESEGADALHSILAGSEGEVAVLVGPEGGLTDAELRALRGAGFRQAWLGPLVLRAETAAIAAVVAVSMLLLERQTWKKLG